MKAKLDIMEFIQTRLNKILSKPNYPTLKYRFGNMRFGKRSQFDTTANDYYIKLDFEAKGLNKSQQNPILKGQYCNITTSRSRLKDTVNLFLELETKLPQMLTDLVKSITDLTDHHTELSFNENGEGYNSDLTISVFIEDDINLRNISYSYIELDLFPTNTLDYNIKVYYSEAQQAKYNRDQAKALLKEIAERII